MSSVVVKDRHRMERLAIAILTPGDVLRESWSLGASTAAHMGFGLSIPYMGLASFGSSGSFEVGQSTFATITFTKDQLGANGEQGDVDHKHESGLRNQAGNPYPDQRCGHDQR